MSAATATTLGALCRRLPAAGGKRGTRTTTRPTRTTATSAATPSSSEISMVPEGLPRTAKIGILGGGQLGRMLAIAAAPMGVRLNSLDPTPSSPASITAIQTEGSYGSREDILAFAKDCDVVTVEIEHIDVGALKELEDMAGLDAFFTRFILQVKKTLN
jgi:lactate dehydrogenase-like 2-hydroxyacid dehydrogenase